MPSVDLYTCPARTHGADAPLIKHPCGVAAKALDLAGHTYSVKVVGGFKSLPFSRRGKRDQIIEMTGQQDVPVLVLDDGTAIHGSGAIVDWARSDRASAA
jgi:Glutathione S-transferase, N-terminal domain